MAKIIAINSGSSSLKFQLFDMPSENVITKGIIERIGMNDGIFKITINGNETTKVIDIANHGEAVQVLVDALKSSGIIQSLDEISGIGHRVVHGGEIFHDSAVVNDEVLHNIEELAELAPLHNYANLTGIIEFQQVLPNVPAVAVFDTAFHQTMKKEAYLYSLPYEYYEKYHVRKYGFHGISHKYVTQQAAAFLHKPLKSLRLISCHVGSGVSIAAVEEGKSINTSMGFTPLAGVPMGTRSGNIDPALIPYIMKKTHQSVEEVVEVLNKKSGLLGISGISSDLRDIIEAEKAGNLRAKYAIDIFVNRIHQYIGSYAARMKGMDAIIFTAGIGENSSMVRERILEGLEFMGVYCDPKRNQHVEGEEAYISFLHSPVKVLVIPTNEEVMIARDVMRLTNV
ncbi:acetate kinase [Ectobacillus polymachus]|uniref:acetate kinase n=1 Tax=Ectobacillus polymachus TaxID=1508806 RepID=UPI003A8821EE